VQTQHAGPELPKLKMPETKPEPVEQILNMDEETFRRLFNMPKVTEADLQREDKEIYEID